jgi:hypothetical protein
MGCADCDCVVENREHVQVCNDPENCCCSDVPVA